jgi:hypothetical protein
MVAHSNDIFNINPIIGNINSNNLRIRSNPNTTSEILGLLNTGDTVTINDVTNIKKNISNTENYWYKITTREGITGWIFGEYIDYLSQGIPPEFEKVSWNDTYGYLSPVENITINDLKASSWNRFSTNLFFSNEGYYALLDRWDHPKYGRYILQDNIVSFFPPIEIIRFSDKFVINELFYSNETYYEGAPVFKNKDETVVFVANGSINTKIGETVRMYQHYCIKIWEKAKANKNEYLFSLPDISSKNMFENDFYGRKATEATVIKLAKTIINNVEWYYVLFDFSSGEPADGGGPFYEGWLPEDYFL